MKIVHIIPGSGGTFYCQNCLRDNDLVRVMKDMKLDVKMVPMYLPLSVEKSYVAPDTPVFYGAVNIYLKQKMSFYRHAPVWVEKLLDSSTVLNFAARMSGSTSTDGLEEMTLSMLHGENGKQATELDQLIQWLKKDGVPDIVHLSNALLLGLAKRLKNDLGTTVICSLQDENQWTDPMPEKYQEKVWSLMGEKARHVDAFVSVSDYYAKAMQKKMSLPDEKLHTVYLGIDTSGYKPAQPDVHSPVIGYLSRITEPHGLDVLLNAFISLKDRMPRVKLHVTGGHTADDREFIKTIQSRIVQHNLENDVTFLPDFNKQSRVEFLQRLSLMCVPMVCGEAFGMYLLEGLTAGVPFVQPDCGAYPELAKITGGGALFDPNDPDTLVDVLYSLLRQPEKLQKMGEKGRRVVMDKFGIEVMAEEMVKVYKKVKSG